MESANIANPFVVGKYVAPQYFCDREQETALLAKHIDNGRNVALISSRLVAWARLVLYTMLSVRERLKRSII